MAEHVFKRKAYDKMLEWRQNRQGRTALLIEGARRVGKSTLVRQFAKSEYKSFIFIDFNIAPEQVLQLFESGMHDLDVFFFQLQTLYHTTLFNRQSVIVFDEVQRYPRARQMVKYFVEDGRYDYIETGSLISIHQNVKDITIPSEEERLELYPLDYEEFRWAIGDMVSVTILRQFLEKEIPLGPALQNSMRDLRLYMLVGGMPQAVNEYINTNNLQQVDHVKRQILQLYAEDFHKIDPLGRISSLFMAIPAQLSKQVARYQPSTILSNTDGPAISAMLFAMVDSKVVNIAYHVNDPNIGMASTIDVNRYKLFLADTGLFVTLMFWEKDFTENVIYNKLLSDKLPTNLGYVYENLVAQMLRSAGNTLYYHTFPKDERHNYEIDFLLSRGNKLCPIEVKASGYKSHTSLDAFCRKYSARIGTPYLLYTKDLARDGQTLMLPIQMTGLI